MLRRWGISAPLIRLACGDVLHELFRLHYGRPPWHIYRSVEPPAGPPLAALWEWSSQIVGVWRGDNGLEFIRFSFEAPKEYRILAHTEQGFWITQFDFLYEIDAPLADLRAAARAVEFQFVEEYLAARQTAERTLGTFEAHERWLRALVASIDGSPTTSS